MSYRITNLLIPLALITAAGCIDFELTDNKDPVDPLDGPPPCIEVNPSDVQFADLEVGVADEVSEVVTVSNSCEGDLEIRQLGLKNDDDGAYTIGAIGSILVPQNSSTEFTVTFSPKTAQSYPDKILIDSNDPENPTAEVRLRGTGIAPKIEVSDTGYDFGAPFIGCENGQPVGIKNVGNADLIIDSINVNTSATNQFNVDINEWENGSLPFTISPFSSSSEEVEIFVDYLPLDTSLDQAYVLVNSNDPYTPEVIISASGTGTEYGNNLDVFVQPLKAETDILFTVDRSCSMYDEAEAVITNFGTFVETIITLDADFHVATAVGDNGCIAGSEPYIDNSFSQSEAVSTMEVMVDWDKDLQPYGSNTERGYMIAEAALSNSNIGPGGCNEDFYRSNAFLSIVHVSDEPEQSVNSWSYYVGVFQSLKADPDDIKVHAVAGDYPSGCGSAAAGTGYYEGTVATGGLFLSICATDWANHLEDLAAESVSINDSFELSQPAVPGTIEVDVDGLERSTGWYYDASTNSVVFETDLIPSGGSQVEVFYQLLPDCES